MNKLRIRNIIILISILTSSCFAADYIPMPKVCFTPGQDCRGMIIDKIKDAKKSIYINAYSFTDVATTKALINAKQHGINVEAILDKSNTTSKYSGLSSLLYYKIPVKIDYKVSIAHNKVMIIDDKYVITGSYNFSNSAQVRNSENLLILDSSDLADKYMLNYKDRDSHSISVISYCSKNKCKLDSQRLVLPMSLDNKKSSFLG